MINKHLKDYTPMNTLVENWLFISQNVRRVGQSAAKVVCPAHTWWMNLHAKIRKGRQYRFYCEQLCIALIDFLNYKCVGKAKIKISSIVWLVFTVCITSLTLHTHTHTHTHTHMTGIVYAVCVCTAPNLRVTHLHLHVQTCTCTICTCMFKHVHVHAASCKYVCTL